MSNDAGFDWRLAGIVAVGFVLRASYLPMLPTGDELGNVDPGGVVATLLDPENAINPPLLRVMGNLAPTNLVVTWGRILALIAGTAALPLVHRLARTVHPPTALLVTAWVAILPTVVVQAAQFRSYALLLPALVWHLWAVTAERPRQVAISAFVLPQIHFATVPLLLIEGVALAFVWYRDAIKLFVPAAAGFAPYGVFMLAGFGKDALHSANPLRDALRIMTLGAGQDTLKLGMLVLAGASIYLWRVGGHAQRTATVGLFAALLTPLITSFVHLSRDDLGVLVVPFIAALAGWVTLAYGRVATAALLLLLTPFPDNKRWHESESARRLVAELPDIEASTVVVHPSHHVLAINYVLTEHPHADRCGEELCMTWNGRHVRGWDGEGPVPADSYVLSFDRQPPTSPEGCTQLRSNPHDTAWSCR